jgi:hypothetical protein
MEEEELEKLLELKDEEYQLLNKMVVKVDEAVGYQRISLVLTLIWLFEILYTFFWTSNSDSLYWVIWCLCLVGWIHVDRKYKRAMDEYNELKEEYSSRFEDNF